MKKKGARAHPGSGSGNIRFDGSTDEEVIEVKTAERTHVLSAKYLEGLFVTATKQGKEARLIINFPNLELEAVVRRPSK